MDDNDLRPMTDGDTTPPTSTPFQPAPPLKDAGTPFAADTPTSEVAAPIPASAEEPKPVAPTLPTSTADAKQQVVEGAGRLSQQASDKALMFADQGKQRAVGVIEQVSQMLIDAAGQVDEKLGDQYGQYARTAAGTVQDYADQLRDAKVDDLLDDARALVRKSPGVAIGAAAAVGFVVARLVSAGLDQRDA